jgi:hypothetical protein
VAIELVQWECQGAVGVILAVSLDCHSIQLMVAGIEQLLWIHCFSARGKNEGCSVLTDPMWLWLSIPRYLVLMSLEPAHDDVLDQPPRPA